MVRNEDPLYVEEWARHHFDLGVEHIYFLNHAPNSIVIPHLDHTTIWDVPPPRQQPEYYWKALEDIKSHWTAVIDADEFIICNGALPELLERYEEFDALIMNWLMFGSSKHKKKVYPIKSNYHARTPCTYEHNTAFKSIVKSKYKKGVHFFGGHVVNEKYQVIPDMVLPKDAVPFTGDKIRVNHYFTRSREDWRERMMRGTSNGARNRGWDWFNTVDAACTVYDLMPTQIHGYQELSGNPVIPFM